MAEAEKPPGARMLAALLIGTASSTGGDAGFISSGVFRVKGTPFRRILIPRPDTLETTADESKVVATPCTFNSISQGNVPAVQLRVKLKGLR